MSVGSNLQFGSFQKWFIQFNLWRYSVVQLKWGPILHVTFLLKGKYRSSLHHGLWMACGKLFITQNLNSIRGSNTNNWTDYINFTSRTLGTWAVSPHSPVPYFHGVFFFTKLIQSFAVCRISLLNCSCNPWRKTFFVYQTLKERILVWNLKSSSNKDSLSQSQELTE